MVSWGSNIVIAEPAPAAARVARYLAPRPKSFSESDDDSPVIAVLVIVAVAIGLGLIGNAVGAIAGALFGKGVITPVWVGFEVLLLASSLVSYGLVARYGLRFSGEKAQDKTAEGTLRIAAERGNTAWRCLPTQHRQESTERLRAMNAAARLLLIDMSDEQAQQVLRKNSSELHLLALASLPQ